jgi:hypothetical protein
LNYSPACSGAAQEKDSRQKKGGNKISSLHLFAIAFSVVLIAAGRTVSLR